MKILNENLLKLDEILNLAISNLENDSLTLLTSKGAQWFFFENYIFKICASSWNYFGFIVSDLMYILVGLDSSPYHKICTKLTISWF